MININVCIDLETLDVEIDPECTLMEMVEQVLDDTGNHFPLINKWEVMDYNNAYLELNKKVSEFNFNKDTLLYIRRIRDN